MGSAQRRKAVLRIFGCSSRRDNRDRSRNRIPFRLDPLENENSKAYGLPREIVVKEHYWSCPENGTGGNAIDLLVQVIGMSFNEAMNLLQRFVRPTTS